MVFNNQDHWRKKVSLYISLYNNLHRFDLCLVFSSKLKLCQIGEVEKWKRQDEGQLWVK